MASLIVRRKNWPVLWRECGRRVGESSRQRNGGWGGDAKDQERWWWAMLVTQDGFHWCITLVMVSETWIKETKDQERQCERPEGRRPVNVKAQAWKGNGGNRRNPSSGRSRGPMVKVSLVCLHDVNAKRRGVQVAGDSEGLWWKFHSRIYTMWMQKG
jgi:hypothetical protein